MQGKIVVSIVSIFLCGYSYGQKNMYKGYFVTNSGDTVSCFIKRSSSEYNPTKFSYKTDSTSGDYKTKTVDEIISFGIYGGDEYQRYTVNMTTSFTDLANLGNDPESNKKYQTGFFKIYKFNKQVQLLVFRDKVKARYFLMEGNDSIPYELEYHIYRRSKEGTVVMKKETYKKQLAELVDKYSTESGDAKERLVYIQYDEKLIFNFLDKLLGTEQNIVLQSSLQLKVINKVELRFYVGGGVNSYQYNAKNIQNGKSVKTEHKFTGSINAGVDLVTDKIRNRFFIRVDFTFTPMSFLLQGSLTEFGQTVSMERKLNNNFFLVSPTFNFKVYDGHKTKLFTAVGLGYNMSLATKYIERRRDIPNDNYFLQKGRYDGLHLQAGLNALVNTKIIIGADYTVIGLYRKYTPAFIGVRVGWIFN